jgi:hypothetical protein
LHAFHPTQWLAQKISTSYLLFYQKRVKGEFAKGADKSPVSFQIINNYINETKNEEEFFKKSRCASS